MLGAVSAANSDNVSIKEDSNLSDDVSTLSSQNKLEISNEVSISETNTVDSQNDNLGNDSSAATLSSSNSDDTLKASISEDNNNNQSSSNNENTLKNSESSSAQNDSGNSTSSKVPVVLKVTERVVSNSTASIFKVSVSDSETGKSVNGYKVLLILDGKKYLGVTDNKGIAEITAKALAKGAHEVTLKFAGTFSRYSETIVTQQVDVFRKVLVNMKVTSAVSNKTGTIFKVSLSDSETGKIMAGSKVLLILDGKKYLGVTDKNGIAQFTTKSLSNGLHPVTLKFAGTFSRYDETIINQKVDVFRKVLVNMKVTSAVSDKTSTIWKVSVKDAANGKAVSGFKVLLTLQGKKYLASTDKNGMAQFTTKSLAKGTYAITLKFAGSFSRYDETISNQKVSVFRKFPPALSVTEAIQGKSSTVFKVSVYDSEAHKGASGYKVLLILDGKKYLGMTDSNGIARVTTKALANGIYDVTLKFAGSYSRYEPATVSQKVNVGVDYLSLNSVISASRTVKNHVEKYGELPSSVKINGVSYSIHDYLYMASRAVYNLKTGDLSYIAAPKVVGPESPLTATSLGNLYNYYPVAKNVINYQSKYGKMPNYATSDVGKIGYDGLVYAFSRVLTYYGDHSSMPNYVTIKSISTIASPNAVNTKNTISDLGAYLAASKNCQVDNAQIKALVDRLTSGLTSDAAKATAIYNYVRDSVSYSFYYDTRQGAVGTLNSKYGNCVDQSHLLVALYRTADLPARYVHGTCTFSSGTYGHVWTQVLLGDVWTVGDPTSTRNSLGSVANWNTNSYSLKGYYSAISF